MGSELSGTSTRKWSCRPLVCSVIVGALGVVACSTDNPADTVPPSNAGSAGAATAGAASAGTGNVGEGGSSSHGGAANSFCSLGTPVEGAQPAAGFCVRSFASVAAVRTLVFAPNGDLFVASPSAATPGGSANGSGQILVLSDDNRDGIGESHVFIDGLADVHGLALGGGYLYFTSATTVYRTPYVVGQRAESGPREDLGMPMTFGNGRWTHGLARSVGGSLLASSGEYSSCGLAPTGSISQVASGGSAIVASGFRNPMYLRCHYKDELCAANELGEDQESGAREKFIVIRPDTNYGYPCCFGSKQPRSSGSDGACQAVAPEDASYTLGNTPFGFDWERETWPAPYTGGVFVALHGSAYSSPPWAGAKIVFAPADPTTHLPARDAWQEFVGGFGPDGGPLQRPADVAFSPDGRLFFADDLGSHVYWVAPEHAN
jgi:glucose/arabinose dehydrogenase